MRNVGILPVLKLSLLALICCTLSGSAFQWGNEDYQYEIRYKWGLIEKVAANATLSLRVDGAILHPQLRAWTVGWANDFYCVRDTLSGTVDASHSCLPLQYVKANLQGGTYNHDVVNYQRTASQTIGHATRFKQKGNSPAQCSDTTLYAQGPTYDLLSIFYYIRTLPLSEMEPGTTLGVNVFSGYTSQQVVIRFDGVDTVNLPSSGDWDAYKMTFNFSMNGRQTERPMYVWLSTDPTRRPIKLEGVLEIGSVQGLYLGARPN